MKKVYAVLLALLLMLCSSSAYGETLRYRINDRNEGFLAFQAAHPELQYEHDTTDYLTRYQFLGALVTGEFDSDVFLLRTQQDDCQQIFTKGYCVDISQSDILRIAIAQMHPSIQAQVSQNGKIYALPDSITFSYFSINRNAWTEAGLITADIPQSFPQLLDFLVRWCDRLEIEEVNIRVISSWVPELYNSSSYVSWLTRLLVYNQMMQLEHAGQPLRFHTQEMLALLGRVKEIGTRIYQLEPAIDSLASGEGKQLLKDVEPGNYSSLWPKHVEDMFFLPINDTQPRLLQASLIMKTVNVRTKIPELSIELMEYICKTMPERETVFLFQDAVPVLNPNFKRNIASTLNNIEGTQEILKDTSLSMTEKQDLENDLRRYQDMYEKNSTDEYKYLMSAAQLEDYEALAGSLYFPKPGFFTTGEDHFRLMQLIDIFAADQQDATGFLQELDRVVSMMEKENGAS